MVLFFVSVIFLLIAGGVIGLTRVSRIHLGWRVLIAVIWAFMLYFGSFAVLNEWRASDRRQKMISQCEANLRKIGAALEQYRKTNGAYPPSVDALAPLLNKNKDTEGTLYCPRASQVRDRVNHEDNCHDRPGPPEYYLGDCFGKIFAKGNTGPSDYVLHTPGADSKPGDILVEEREFNHPQGWSTEAKWKTVLRVDGSIGIAGR